LVMQSLYSLKVSSPRHWRGAKGTWPTGTKPLAIDFSASPPREKAGSEDQAGEARSSSAEAVIMQAYSRLQLVRGSFFSWSGGASRAGARFFLRTRLALNKADTASYLLKAKSRFLNYRPSWKGGLDGDDP
jgi:hypothetical protein